MPPRRRLPGAGTGKYKVLASRVGDSALALLVARVSAADDHDPAVPPDDPAVVADPLDARLDLHGVPNSRCTRAPASGRDRTRPLPGYRHRLLVAVDDAPAS